MAVRSVPKKVSGTAGAVAEYLKEEADIGIDRVAEYYGTERDGVLFTHVRGKAAKHLEGLDLSRGLTRGQFEHIFGGKWNGTKLVSGGYAPVQAVDEEGKPLFETDPETGKKTNKKVFEMTPALNKKGEPVVDKLTGEVKMKRVMKEASVSAYDINFTVDKSISEFLIAHPKYVDAVRDCFLQAVDIGMATVVEGENALVAETIKGTSTETSGSRHRLVKADGLLWATVIGNSARPTPESLARSSQVDPHLHAHVLLFSAAYMGDGKWQKIDGDQLFKTAEHRAQVVSTQFNRLLEERGIKISYSEPDRKGRIYSEIEGSNPEVRHFYSTNTARMWKLQLEFERKYNRTPNARELDEIKSKTKLAKTKAAKEADTLGNKDQLDRWRQDLKDAGLELTIAKPSVLPKHRDSVNERLDILYGRLERPDGVARDIQCAAVFGPEVVMPAVHRAAEGLGFTVEELEMIGEVYRETKLVLVRDHDDPERKVYTTEAILAAETETADLFTLRTANTCKAVPTLHLTRAIRGQRVSLDPEQEQAVRAICSDSRLTHIIGRAGAGKTASVKPAVEALRAAGLVDEVVVVSTGRRLAVTTGAKVGADKSWSVEAMRHAAAKGWKPDDKTLVVLDEAAMASAFEIADVLRMTRTAGRMVSISDTKQAREIGAGGWLDRELERHDAVELVKVYRHTDWKDTRDFELIRQGNAHEGLTNMADRGRVHAADDHAALVRLAQDRYEHWRERGADVHEIAVLHTGSNHTLDEINRAIQRNRIDANELSEFSAFTVAEQTTGRKWNLHTGERIIFNAGVYLSFDQDPVLNGQLGTIVNMAPDGACRVQLDGEERRTVTVRLEHDAVTQPIAPAYAVSNFKFQGDQVRIALVAPGDANTASLNAGYAAVTRGVECTEILLDRSVWGTHPVQGLAEAWSHETQKVQASYFIAMLDEPLDEQADDLDPDDLTYTPQDEALEQLRQIRRDFEGPDLGLSL